MLRDQDVSGQARGGSGNDAIGVRHTGGRQRPGPTAWDQMGGLGGLTQSSLPSVAFVLGNAASGLRAGIGVAVGTGIVFTVLRAWRRQSLRPALGGFAGVAISSAIAYHTGSARDYFLPDIWFSLSCCIALALSIAVRWPLAGVMWSALNRDSMAWRDDKPSRLGFDLATAVLASAYAVRFGVQHWLYDRGGAGWMALAKIVINYPLWALALGVMVWAVRRSRKRLGGTRMKDTPAAGVPPRPAGHHGRPV